MKILAIDQASTSGWCVSENLHGIWDFKTRADESHGMKLLRFKAKLKEVCEAEGVEVVVYERVAGFHKNAIIHAAKMVAVIESFCEDNGIQYRAYSATEIKKYATGKGNANKDKMVASCIERYGFTPVTDDEADATFLWHLANDDLNG